MSTHDALRHRALTARAAGDHAAAVNTWRVLLDVAPDDWQLALEIKRDLLAGLHLPDSDPRFRRAARFLPDELWLDHYSHLWVFHGADLEHIDARGRALLERWPDNAALQAVLGDVARQRRDWTEAAHRFDRAHALDPDQEHYPVKAVAARLYADLSQRTWPATGDGYRIYVVNLDSHPERMKQIGEHYGPAPVPRQRVPSIEGSRLATAAVTRLTGDPGAPRGTLGCFLGHAAAWEALLASGEPAGLIVEDDTIPLLDLPPTLGGLGLPDGWELCFVNDRLEPRRPWFGTTPLADVMRAFHPEENAPGADGYLLTREGARKLLQWTGSDGMADDVDWRMVAYGLSRAEVAAIPARAHARRELDRLSARIRRAGRLRAYVLHPALIRTVGTNSDREDQNRIP